MKLATLKDCTRDGRLVVVSRDLTRCSEVGHIARTLQAALDDWAHVGPRLARSRKASRPARSRRMRFHEHDAAVAAAARLSVGGWLGLCQSRRAGAQGARRRDAGQPSGPIR